MIKMNTEIYCNCCKELINKPKSYFNKQKKLGFKLFYCSIACYKQYMHQQKQLHAKQNIKIETCKQCGKNFSFDKLKTKERKFCSSSCAAKYNNKNHTVTQITKQKISNSLKKYNKINKVYHINHKIKKICPVCNNEFFVFKSMEHRIYCSRICYKSDNKHLYRKQGKTGGYIKGSSRGKKGWYKGYWCDSSWQLAFVIYNLQHDIKFKRNTEGFKYIFNNVEHLYYPDFIMQDGTYIEIKGLMTQQNKSKLDSFKKSIILIDKDKIQIYLNYVIEKYGKNFIELYEDNLNNRKLNKCIICGNPAYNICCSRVCSGKYRASINHKNNK